MKMENVLAVKVGCENKNMRMTRQEACIICKTRAPEPGGAMCDPCLIGMRDKKWWQYLLDGFYSLASFGGKR